MSQQSQDPWTFLRESLQLRLGVRLDEKAEQRLKRIFAKGYERANDMAEFDAALGQLAERLGGELLFVRMQRDTPMDQPVSLSEFNAAFRSICPLWPFCK